MTIRHFKDAILFRMSAAEMRQTMEQNGMIYWVWLNLQADLSEAAEADRWMGDRAPLKVCHEEQARGHVLQCRVHLWPYFREIEAANPLEREIRAEMLAVGLSGEAERRTARYAEPIEFPSDPFNRGANAPILS